MKARASYPVVFREKTILKSQFSVAHGSTGHFALLLTLLLNVAWVCAQTPATAITWRGRIHNAGGAPLAGADITLRGEGRSAQASGAANGAFRIGSLTPGQYRLTIGSGGRKTDSGDQRRTR